MTAEHLATGPGHVTVPDALVPGVLAALTRDLTSRVRANGGMPSVEYTRFLTELYAASERVTDRPSSGVGTMPAETVTVDSLTVAEAARRLECSTRWVRTLARRERIAARRAGGVWLIDPVSLDRYARGDHDDQPTRSAGP